MKSKYLDNDPFSYPYGDGDIEIAMRQVKIVTTRKPQTCVPPPEIDRNVHEIPAGTKARLESALVEGVWSRCYTCTTCMDTWLSLVDRRLL